MKTNVFTKKIAELDVVETVVNFCLESSQWWCDNDQGNISFADERHEAMYNAYLNLAEKLTKEYTK